MAGLTVVGINNYSPERGGFEVNIFVDGAHPQINQVPTPKGTKEIGRTIVFESVVTGRQETQWALEKVPPESAWEIARRFAEDNNPLPSVRRILAMP